MQNKEIDDIYG